MSFSIGAVQRTDNNFNTSGVPFGQTRAVENKQIPEQPVNMIINRDGRVTIYNADGDSAEFAEFAEYTDTPPEPAAAAEFAPTSGGTPVNGGTPILVPDGFHFDGNTLLPETGNAASPAPGTSGVKGTEPCETCASRRYVDGSDDPSVSFKTPTKLNPSTAASAVAAHENEHVHNERRKAEREDRTVTQQSVTFHYDTCPDCGRTYIAGGTTRTTTVGKPCSESESDDAEPERQPY